MADSNHRPRSASLAAEDGLPGRFRPLRQLDPSSQSVAKFQLSDVEQVRDYLYSFDSFADAPLEGRNYINHALRRFIITAEMVPPASHPGQRLLEIGGSPYYTTLLLHRLRGYEIYLTNFFGDNYPSVGQQIISSRKHDESYECNFVNVNVEQDPLPYPDRSFDVALFCEVIEHLTQDPTFALVELHRVLKPGGYLLVTTPNVFRLQHLLYMLGGRHNLFHPYSGHGVYGRHQREYSLGELVGLVSGCGYTVIRAEIENFEPCYSRMQRLIKRSWWHRRDNLFVLARSEAERRFYYPSSLYIATQGIHRVVDSDVRMGVNDVGHLGWGWWGLDQTKDGPVRWTTAEALVCLAYPRGGGQEVVIEANGMGKTLGPVLIAVVVGEQKKQFQLADDQWRELILPLPSEVNAEEVECRIRVEHTRCPRDLGISADDRELGLMIRRLYIR